MKRSALLPILASLGAASLGHFTVGFAWPKSGPDSAAYVKEVGEWRKEQESDLTRPQGWLSLVGLSWLKQGANTLGSAEGSAVMLPAWAPKVVGKLVFQDGKVRLVTDPSLKQAISVDGKELATDGESKSVDIRLEDSTVKLGTATFVIIQRGQRTGVRIWDSQSPALKAFKGAKWYPVNEHFKISADYTAYPTAKSIPILNVLGDTTMVPNPGYVTFKVNGKVVRLEAQALGDGFFFNFHDGTSGRTTYHAGRFLNAPPAVNGKVILDFNKATNPPCAFTSYATCPLPPKANITPVPIPAGEQYVHADIEE